MFSVARNITIVGFTVPAGNLASLRTGTVEGLKTQLGIFLSPLKTNDWFYLSGPCLLLYLLFPSRIIPEFRILRLTFYRVSIESHPKYTELGRL